jgi:pyridoxal phosphate enzyme (YggS family)
MDEPLVLKIQERHRHVLEQINAATVRSGREVGAVHLVAVTKSQPLEVVLAAISAGLTSLGENYAEEAINKISAGGITGVEWHMIGHVQSRKAEVVVQYFTMMHSLDSVKLAARLDKFCGELNRKLLVLLEINVSGEETKYGFPAWNEKNWPDLDLAVEQINSFSNLRIGGLMTMPPYFDDPEETRPFFKRLISLQDYLRTHHPQLEWKELSMGTSADFIPAIEEGATTVRLGQALFGPRVY